MYIDVGIVATACAYSADTIRYDTKRPKYLAKAASNPPALAVGDQDSRLTQCSLGP